MFKKKNTQSELPAIDADFVAFDVETANENYASICQVGFSLFKNGQAIDTKSFLVDPQDDFSGFNINIHGITPDMVKGEPTFPEIYSSVRYIFGDRIVAHHTLFDRLSISRVCEKYNLNPLSPRWLDTARVVRRQWPQYRVAGYGLPNLAADFGIDYRAHDAGEDARAAGIILIHALSESGLTLEEWHIQAYKNIRVDITSHEPNPDGPLFGEKICFTGSLSITRDEAATIAADLGCDVISDVNKWTTILVVGDQNTWRLAGYDKSSKHRKAEQLISKGRAIRIIGENDFHELANIA
jgi:DNA polymerase III subunit epsilon